MQAHNRLLWHGKDQCPTVDFHRLMMLNIAELQVIKIFGKFGYSMGWSIGSCSILFVTILGTLICRVFVYLHASDYLFSCSRSVTSVRKTIIYLCCSVVFIYTSKWLQIEIINSGLQRISQRHLAAAFRWKVIGTWTWQPDDCEAVIYA